LKERNMNRYRSYQVILTAGLCLVAIVPAFAADKPKAVMAYYETSGSDGALHAFFSHLQQLPTDTFAIDKKGTVSGTVPSAALAFARSKGLQTFATVSNFGQTDFVPAIAHAIVTNKTTRAAAIQNMLAVVQANGYTGLNIDFEAVPRGDRKAFTTFIRMVGHTMRRAGYLTVVSVPAETQDDPQDSWAGAFDFKALAPHADILQLMTYDENGPWGPPGPVAGLDWVEACVKFAVTVVPSEKISLGMPAYGYDWNLTRNTGVQVYWKQIPALLARTGATPQWDTATSSPYFSYTARNGDQHVAWYEDSESIPLKAHLAVSYNLAGVSVFALGFEDRHYWAAVDSGLGSSN
jgi:spore germination protein YaaH